MKKSPAPKRASVDEALARLNALPRDPTSPVTREALSEALRSRIPAVVRKAARWVGELELHRLVPELVAAFHRLLIDPVRSDPGCQAKTAVLEALNQLEHLNAEVFLLGIRHVQREPSWGGSEDSAAALRGVAALGLVQCRYPEVGYHLVELLADPAHQARAGAARALLAWGRREAALLLRFKLLEGDSEPGVMEICFEALLKLEEAQAVPFVARFLDGSRPVMSGSRGLGRALVDDTQLQESAAMALSQSRLAEAFEPLRLAFEATMNRELRRVLLTAMALLRQASAVDFLVSLVAGGGKQVAADAIQAVAPLLFAPGLRARVGEVVLARRELELREAFEAAVARSEGQSESLSESQLEEALTRRR